MKNSVEDKLGENSEQNSNENSVKRKRGRPRKALNVSSQHAEKKKRGRKPKDFKKNFNLFNFDQNEEEIILHLPINSNDVKRYSKEETKLKNSNSSPADNNVFTITDISYDNSSDETINENQKDLLNRLKDQDTKIKCLESELEKYKELVKDDFSSGMVDKKVIKMNLNFFDIKNDKHIIVEKTEIACWWCTYNFDNLPCFIPEKFIENKYYVFGCFCSYNCAASYNINMNDYKVWERYSLLKKLYNTIFENNEDITIAPPREALQKFGGILSIENFRKNSRRCEKDYRFIMPPMVSIIPLLEESLNGINKMKKIKLTDSDDNLVLRRTKPLPFTKNTLIETMGLIQKNKKASG